MTACRWNGSEGARMLRSHLKGCEGVCEGCEPCPERHCQLCGREHVTVDGRGTDQTCATCIGDVRSNVRSIVLMNARLLPEAVHRGVNSEAANLAGPVADPEAWSYRAASARQGRADHVSLTEDDDLSSPLWVLGSWDMLIREHLEQPTDALVRVTAAAAYIDGHLTRLAHDAEFAFEELAREVRRCHGHLEDVLAEGEREERGAPCPMCGRANLVRVYGASDEEDGWSCPRKGCGERYSEHDYRTKVEATYIHHADRLTASQMREAYRISEGSTRGWASLGKVRKLGKDHHGLTLYSVEDALAMRDGTEQASA